MSAFAQVDATGDLDISTGNLRIERGVAQVTAWKLSNLFGFAKGEWFRDTRQGLPYFQYVFVSNPNLQLISTVFERVIRSAPGVAAITAMNLDYRPRQRTLGASFAAVTDTGAVLQGGLGTPFIVAIKPGESL
jgi:hypothetical protein